MPPSVCIHLFAMLTAACINCLPIPPVCPSTLVVELFDCGIRHGITLAFSFHPGCILCLIFSYRLSKSCTRHWSSSPSLDTRWPPKVSSRQRSSIPDLKLRTQIQPFSLPASRTKGHSADSADSGRFCLWLEPKRTSPGLGQPESSGLGNPVWKQRTGSSYISDIRNWLVLRHGLVKVCCPRKSKPSPFSRAAETYHTSLDIVQVQRNFPCRTFLLEAYSHRLLEITVVPVVN